MLSNTRKTLKSLQSGFTLFELLIVLGIIGIIAMVTSPAMLGTKDGANATLIARMAENTINNWQIFCNEAGITTNVTSNPGPATGKAPEDVIFAGGTANVATAYQTAYTRSGIKPLSNMVSNNGTNWVINGTTNEIVSIAGGGTNPLTVQILNVPEEVVLLMAQKINPSITALTKSGADVTVGNLTYNFAAAATSGAVKFSK